MKKKFIFEHPRNGAGIFITPADDEGYFMSIGDPARNIRIRISAKALREMADILDGNEPEVIRKTITL